MTEYEELRIRLCAIGRDRYLVLANGPASAAAVVRIGRDHGFRDAFARLLDEEFRRAERAPTPVPERVRRLGERLFGTLFPEPLVTCLFESARRAEQHGRHLRIRFDLPPELADLPIEVLCPPLPYRRLTGDSRFSLVRTARGAGLAPGRLPTAVSRPARFRVLLVVAEAQGGRSPIDLRAEVTALQEAMSAGPRTAAVTVETLGWPTDRHRRTRPTLANLRSALARNDGMPLAVVFLAHGAAGDRSRGGEVLLENKDGSPDPVSGERLAAELAAVPNLRLVVLNLCAGAQPAPGPHPGSAVADEVIARGIPAVVAMQADVSNSAAARFTPALFTELAANRSVDEAVAVARHDMVNPRDETTLEWATPVLLLHQQCRHTWLFKTVKVVDRGVVPVDPLARGSQSMSEVDDPPDGVVRIEALVEASRFARTLGDWRQVARYADMGREEHPEPLEWLAQEARLELAVDRCVRLCELLTGEDGPVKADGLLDGLRAAVPEQVFDCLAGEIRLAAKASAALDAATRAAETGDWNSAVAYCDEILADLPDGYRDAAALRARAVAELELDALYVVAEDHRDAGDWPEAAAAFAAVADRCPDGYRDAGPWLDYARGRVLEAAEDLPGAIAAYLSADGIADAQGRAALCRGRQADADEDWSAALDGYRAADESGVDVGPALRYAVGRLAADRGDFATAAAEFGDLPDQYRDARAYARFAEGKVAFEAADWAPLLDALHVLPPDFHHGDVSRMRALARAHLAAERKNWQAVVEALQGIDDDEVWVLRATGQARAAEQRGDWPALVAVFRQVQAPTDELADLWTYATGRVAEASRDLAGALAAYRRVPDDVRDVRSRRDLIRGAVAEDTADWTEAQRWFGALPPNFEDCGRRAGYAATRAAFGRADWPSVVSGAEAIGGFRDADAIAVYGRARIAESDGDWPLAVELSGRCGYADSDVRFRYASARVLAAEGRWSEALAHYRLLPDDHGDVAARRARLTELVASFGWAEGLGDARLAPDPNAAARDDFPYRVLAPLGIGPGASMQRLKDAEMRAMRENLTTAIGVAAALRSWQRRLAVDADLYPIRDPDGLRAALGGLADESTDDPFGGLCAAAPDDTPLLLLHHVGREAAIAAWQERLQADPGDVVTAHSLAVAHRWAARDLDRAEAWEHGRTAWRLCIGMWVTALGDDAYWERWRRERSSCYRFMVPVAETHALRRKLITDLADELHRAAERHDQEDRPALAADYRALGVAIRVEVLGREVLAELRRLPLPDGVSFDVVGGPVFLRAAGLSGRIAEVAARLVHARDDLPDPDQDDENIGSALLAEAVTRLCAAFSRLAPARALLEDGRPERALAMLPDPPRKRFAETGGKPRCTCGGNGSGLCPECARFLAEDPAYLHLGGREARLWQDSVRIAVRCHVEVARAAATGDGATGVDIAVRAVRAALERAAEVGLAVRARREVADFVGAAVEALTMPGPTREPRPDRAVRLVERIRDEVGLHADDSLRRTHAEALYHRAQSTVLDETPDGGTDYDLAVADLRLAIRLSPTSMMARVGLAHTLAQRSADRPRAADHAVTAAEALTAVTEGLRTAPMMIPLLDALKAVADEVRAVIYRTMPSSELDELEPNAPLPGESGHDTAIRLATAARRAEVSTGRIAALLLAVDAVLAEPREPSARETLASLVVRWAADQAERSPS